MSAAGKWRRCQLGDVLERIEAGRSYGAAARPASEGEWGIVKVSSMTYGSFREGENKALPAGSSPPAHLEIQDGDLLLSRANTRDHVGAVVLVGPCRPRLLLSDKSLRLHPSSEVDRRWLLYALRSPAARDYLSTSSSGVKAGMHNISQVALRAMPLHVPPLDEQRRIVACLEDHISRLDAAERYLGSVVSRRDAAQGAVLQAALVGADAQEAGDVVALCDERQRRCPSDIKRGRPTAVAPAAVRLPWSGRWPTVSLEAATDPVRTISYGILKPGPNLKDGVPYVRVVNMRKDVLAVGDLHRTAPEIAAQYSRASLEPNDVLISIRGTYGRVVLVPEALRGANITQDTARLAVLPTLEPTFVALVLRSPWAQAHLRKVARGVAVKGVNITDLRAVPMPVPTMEAQVRLVKRAEELTSDLHAAARSAEVGLRRAATLRRSLLVAAFSGRLTGDTDVRGELNV